MWGSLKSYFHETNTSKNQVFFTSTTEACEIQDSDSGNSEDDWVFIDTAGKEIPANKTIEIKPTQPLPDPRRLSPLTLLDISNFSSPQTSPLPSPTKFEEDWLIAPPPCFVLNCPSMIEISPLEDLLIEHPSMSVYKKVPQFRTKNAHPSMSVYNKVPEFCTTENEHPSISVYNQVSGFCTEKISNAVKKDNAKPRTSRNKVPVCKDSNKNLIIIPTKTSSDLKAFFEQTENMKPAQQAKWESDQYKLCPSYINRQNRVHQYQSRRHHNQKKKSLARPYAEKCKHSF